jgi:DNA-binding NarL/FixJ family response regulator
MSTAPPETDSWTAAEVALRALSLEKLSPAGTAALAQLRAILIRLSDAETRLTPRQQEVAALLAQGLSNRAIAQRLGVKDGTAKLHVAAVLNRLGVSTREAAGRLTRGDEEAE